MRAWRRPAAAPTLDAAGRIRVDDLEMDPQVQAEVDRLWLEVNSANLLAISDYAGFKADFRRLFGFEVPGVDYTQPVEISAQLA